MRCNDGTPTKHADEQRSWYECLQKEAVHTVSAQGYKAFWDPRPSSTSSTFNFLASLTHLAALNLS